MPILVTGAAGFIGYHVARRLLEDGEVVIGVDNLNAYYSVELKEARLAQLRTFPTFVEERVDLADDAATAELFARHDPAQVIHLAAQAGVRYSIDHPEEYIHSNLVAYCNVLEACRRAHVEHLVFASSSSVYGSSTPVPFSVRERVDEPMNLYAATKKANEVLARAYSYLYRLPVTGLRFFTVYGPWGRPDMAYFRWTEAILNGREIDLHNHGNHWRDFTYITDIVDGVMAALRTAPAPGSAADDGPAPFRLYNLGNHQPVHILDFLRTLERCLGVPARVRMLPRQPGEILTTYADIDESTRDLGFRPHTSIDQGLRRFVDWYLAYHSMPRTNGIADQPHHEQGSTRVPA